MSIHEFFWFFDVAGFGLFLSLGVLVVLALRHWTGKWFQRVCSQVGDLPSACAMTGRDVALRLLESCGLTHIPVHSTGPINCYHPWKREIRLRPSTYISKSLSALATAAHEVGHAQHFSEAIWRCRLRSVLWPVCWVLPIMAATLAMLGILGDIPVSAAHLVPGMLIVSALIVMLQLPITLPLERDASQRATRLVRESGLLAPAEEPAFERVLDAAWKTHASREVQRWIVLISVTLATGCFPFFQTYRNPLPAGLLADVSPSLDAMRMREMPTPPAPAVLQPADEPPTLVDYDDVLEGWNHFPALMSMLPLLVVIAIIPLTLLGKSKLTNYQHLSREAKAVLRNNAASAMQAKGDHEAALEEYAAALGLNPRLTVAWYNRGQTNFVVGRLDDAAHDFDAAVRLAPHFLDAVAARGQARLLLGQDAPGLADLEMVRAQCPTNSSALGVLSDYWQRKGDLERAISVWTDALALDPENSDFYRTRGLLYYFQGNQDRAVSDQTVAIRLDPTDAIARNNRGAALLKRGEWALAIDDLRAATQIDPKLPNSYRHLAWLQATCPDPKYRDGAAAVSNATRALELTHWKRQEWVEVLAAAYAEVGNFEHALHWQQKAIDESSAETKAIGVDRLKLYQSGQPFRESAYALPSAASSVELPPSR